MDTEQNGENEVIRMVDDKVLYLFSSSHRRIYKQDNMNVLCYPPGFIMHFRYDRKWIGNEITRKKPDDFIDNEAIIVIVDIEKSDKKYFPRFYPVRKAKIKKVDMAGSALHIYFELLPDWVVYENNTKLKDYQSCINSLREKPIEGIGRLEGKFVSFEELSPDIKFSPRTKAWESIIRKIGNLEPYKKTLFYKLDKFCEVKSNKDLKITKFDDIKCGYILESGKRYNLELSFDYGKEPPTEADKEKLIVKVEEENFYTPIPNKIALSFRVDKQSIYLSTKERFFDGLTYLIITFEKELIEGPNVVIPIRVKYNRLRIWSSFLIFFIGLILTSGVIQIYQVPQYALKLLGSFISTSVMFWLYREIK